MMINLVIGMIVGFLVAVPVGPIDMICIRSSLLWGTRSGFITGLGAACADAIYGGCAAFGVIQLTSILMSYKLEFQIIGGTFLCILGIVNWLKKQKFDSTSVTKKGQTMAFLTTFFLGVILTRSRDFAGSSYASCPTKCKP